MWNAKSLAHTLTEAYPQNHMALADGYDYSNLFGTSKNGRDNICINFEHDPSEEIGELRVTLPENSVVSGVFVDARESTSSELESIDVQVEQNGSWISCNTQLDFQNADSNMKALSTTCDDIAG